MKIKSLLIATLLFPFVFSASAATQYITEDLSTFMRNGPGKNYGLNGSVRAGDQVEVLSQPTNGFVKIRDDKGRERWIESNFVTAQKPMRLRLPELEAAAEKARSDLAKAQGSQAELLGEKDDEIAQLTNELTILKREKATFQQQVAELEATNGKLTSRLDTQKQDELMRWMVRGGLVMGGGLILGLLVPYLPRRRKKDDRWM